MSPLVQGKGVPEAAPYDASAPGPHRLVLLIASGQPFLAGSSPEGLNTLLPADWLPSSVGETELVALLGPEREVALGSEWYRPNRGGNPEQVTRVRHDLDVTVRQARTGEVVCRTTLQGNDPPPFPTSVPAGTTKIETMTHLEDAVLVEWLSCSCGVAPCELRSLMWHGGGSATSLAFSPDGKVLAAGERGDNRHFWWPARIRLWRVQDGALLRTIEGASWAIFSPDGLTMATGTFAQGGGGDIALRRASDGALLHELEGIQGDVMTDVAFSPDGRLLAASSDDRWVPGGTIRLWSVPDGAQQGTISVPSAGVTSIDFSPDGAVLAIGLRDGAVELRTIPDGSLLRTIDAEVGERNALRRIMVEFSPDGQILATAASLGDGTVHLWQVSDGALLRTIREYVSDWSIESITFSPDGETLAVLSYKVELWRVSDGSMLRKLEWTNVWSDAIRFSPDGKILAVAQINVYLWFVR